jgi:hypothetical protein
MILKMNFLNHRVGDEVQKIDVVQSFPELLAVDSSKCISKVVPKMVQVRLIHVLK